MWVYLNRGYTRGLYQPSYEWHAQYGQTNTQQFAQPRRFVWADVFKMGTGLISVVFYILIIGRIFLI